MTHSSGIHYGYGTPFATAEEAQAAQGVQVPQDGASGVASITPVDDPFTSPGPLSLMGQFDFLLAQQEMDLGLQKYIFDREFELQERMANASMALQRANAQLSAANAAASRASNERMNAANNALQARLVGKQITSNEYMQALDLEQREAEFARDLSFKQNQFSWQQEMDSASLELQQAQVELLYLEEARNERTLQAQLAANPADTVMYEYYKRGLELSEGGGEPYDPYNLGLGAGGEGGQAPTGNYPAAPPAYTDETLQGLMAAITGEGGALYNPDLGGTGAFGANIPSPNEISRKTFQGLDKTDLEVFGSFLRAGVETSPGGPRVAIDPADYLQQLQQSWVPTLGESGSVPLTLVGG